MMLLFLALSASASAASTSPAMRVEPAAMNSFTASVTIRRGAGVGRDMAPPPWAHKPRKTMVENAAGQPHPAIIYDFE